MSGCTFDECPDRGHENFTGEQLSVSPAVISAASTTTVEATWSQPRFVKPYGTEVGWLTLSVSGPADAGFTIDGTADLPDGGVTSPRNLRVIDATRLQFDFDTTGWAPGFYSVEGSLKRGWCGFGGSGAGKFELR